MGQLTALQKWDVYANPLAFPPAELIAQQGMQPARTYLRDYEAL